MAEPSVQKSSQSSQRIIILLVIIFLVVGGVSLASQYLGKPLLPSQITDKLTITPPDEPEGSPTPTPTPVTIRTGRVVANMSQSAETLGPKLRRVEIDNNDPKVGEKQNIKARILHTSPVVSAEVILTTDSETFTHPLTLASGTNLDGEWTGSWTIEDTVLYKYMFTFVLKGQDGNESKLDYPKR